MPDLTGKQRKELRDLEKAIDSKRVQWAAAYETAKAVEGVAVDTTDGSQVGTLYAELVALRQRRNDLLSKYRAAGINI